MNEAVKQLAEKVENFILVPKNRVKDWENAAEDKEGNDVSCYQSSAVRFCLVGAVRHIAGDLWTADELISRMQAACPLNKRTKTHKSFVKRWSTKEIKDLFTTVKEEKGWVKE